MPQLARTKTAESSTLISCEGARSTTWHTPSTGDSVLEIQKYPDASSITSEAKERLVPPYHWHWYQKEQFVVTQGRFIFTLNGKDTAISASDPNPRVVISPGAPHTFSPDLSYSGPCTIEISAETSPHSTSTTATDIGISERFFRNLYSYLEDCKAQNQSPSLPQLLLFLDSAEVSLAWDLGPRWLMHKMSWALGVVVGRWFGGYVLGLKDSYPEYYDPKLNETKKEQ